MMSLGLPTVEVKLQRNRSPQCWVFSLCDTAMPKYVVVPIQMLHELINSLESIKVQYSKYVWSYRCHIVYCHQIDIELHLASCCLVWYRIKVLSKLNPWWLFWINLQINKLLDCHTHLRTGTIHKTIQVY